MIGICYNASHQKRYDYFHVFTSPRCRVSVGQHSQYNTKEIDLVLGRRAKEQKVDGEKGLIFITRNGTPINSRNFGKALDGLVKAYNRKEVINAESEHRDPVLLPHINPHGRVIIRTS